MPPPWDIFHNRMGWEAQSFFHFCGHTRYPKLLHWEKKKQTQKEHYNSRHSTKDLPALQPRRDVYFLSPEGPRDNYISSTIISIASLPHSYIIKHQGCLAPLLDHHSHHNTPVQSLLGKYHTFQDHPLFEPTGNVQLIQKLPFQVHC